MTYEHNAPALALAELLTRAGYKAEQVDHGVLGSSFSGTRVLVKAYDNGSIQFIAGWREYPASFSLNDANEFNANFRFGSVYLLDDTLMLQSNFLFDSAEEGAEGTLQQAVSLFENLISELLTIVRESSEIDTDIDN